MPQDPSTSDPFATAKRVRDSYASPALSLFARYVLAPFHQNEAQALDDNARRNMPTGSAPEPTMMNKILVGAGVQPAPGESNADFYDNVWGARQWYPTKALEDVYLSGKPRMTADTSDATAPPRKGYF